jgi:hypothetical protein
MRTGVTALSITAGGEPVKACRITGNLGCYLWIGGVILNADAATFRELARASAEAAAIEEECDALKAQPHPFEPLFEGESTLPCRFCGKQRSDRLHSNDTTV